jgi:glycosyl transferase family 25
MITIDLMGGLGNQLFQLAFLQYIHEQTNIPIYILTENTNVSPHTTLQYFETIFKQWKSIIRDTDTSDHTIFEYKLHPDNWRDMFIENVKFNGYFQNYNYIRPSFIDTLHFDRTILTKYPTISDKVFIHIRGGDYNQKPFNELYSLDLSSYYEEAVGHFPNDTEFCVFTNDLEHTRSYTFLEKIKHKVIIENELDSLLLMSECKAGICTNSSFSWWGAYLKPTRHIILPSKWFNDQSYYTSGLYVPDWKVIDIDKWSFIDKVIYINLDSRTDRRVKMESIVSVFGNDRVMRLPAIKHHKGYIGCAQSHIIALEIAIAKQWKNVLILEDDVDWNDDMSGYRTLRSLVNRKYDVIMLGGGSANFNTVSYKITSAQCTSSYLVNNTYYHKLRDSFRKSVDGMVATDDSRTYAIDMYWKHIQPVDDWYFTSPCLLYQRPDYSDVEKQFVDYRGGMHLSSHDVSVTFVTFSNIGDSSFNSIKHHNPTIVQNMFRSYSEIQCPPHETHPYSFKPYAVEHMKNIGYRFVIWVDSCIQGRRSVDTLIPEIEKRGVYIQTDPDWKCGQWANDNALAYFNKTRDDAMNIPAAYASIIAFDFSNPVAHELLHLWKQSCDDGIFNGQWNNNNNTESLDERCKGHRHDQTCLELISDKLGIERGHMLVKKTDPSNYYFATWKCVDSL